MRRLLMMMSIAALAVTGFVPAQAQENGVEEPESTPIVIVCRGTAGYEQTTQGPRWRAKDGVHYIGIGNHKTCYRWSLDTREDPNDFEPRPLPELDPADPERTLDRLYGWAYYSHKGVISGQSPVGMLANFNLSGVGDFACGEGTLSYDGDNYQHHNGINFLADGFFHWTPDWSATFSDGVGEITGTAYARADSTDHDRAISGRIVVDDGAATGACDDSAGASDFYAVLVLE